MALDDVTQNFTVAFSNTPGAVKPLYYLSLKGEKIYSLWTQTYLITSGFIGFAISVQTWVNSCRVTVTSDNGLIDAELNERVCDLIVQKIEEEKERMKDVPEKVSPGKGTTNGKVQLDTSISKESTTDASGNGESKKDK